MLHTETVAGTTLELLKRLEQEEVLSAFNLVGGTALALYMGHRRSVDLDLFTPEAFDVNVLRERLEETYGLRTDYAFKHTLKGTIDGIKIDCIMHAYPLLEPPYVEEGIRLYGLKDIIAMKLSAITDNGSRLKDFIDIACLSTRYSFYEMLQCYRHKFPQANVLRPFKALTYFEDIDFDETVVMLEGKYDWERIRQRLVDMTRNQECIFEYYPL